MHRPESSTNAGFTLVELVITIALIGIVAGIVAPRFFEVSGFNERFFAEDLRAAVTHARDLAVASGCPVQVTVAGSGYALAQRSACSSGAWSQAVIHPATLQAGYSAAPPNGIVTSANVSPFWFDILGRARNGAGSVVDVTFSVGSRGFQVVGETGYTSAP